MDIRRVAVAGIAFTMSIESNVIAQEPESEFCDTVLSQGITDNFYLFSESDQFSLYQRRVCDARFSSHAQMSSAAGELGLSIPMLEALVSFSAEAQSDNRTFQEEYRNFCQSTYQEVRSSSRQIISSQEISRELVNAWESCKLAVITTQQEGLFASVTPQQNAGQFMLQIEVKGPRGDDLRIDGILPSNVSCEIGGTPVANGRVFQERRFSLACSKPEFEAVNLQVNTNYGDLRNPIFIPAGVEPLAALRSEVADLREQIDRLREEEQVEGEAIPSALPGTGIPIHSVQQNNSDDALILVARCSVASINRVLRIYVSKDEEMQEEENVAVSGGVERMTLTAVVPPNWYYIVDYNADAGGSCSATGWRL